MLTCISIYGYEGIFGQSVTVDAKNGEFSSGKSCGPSDFHIAECAWNVQERISGLRNFLDASSHLYKRVCPSVGPSVHRSVGLSVRNAFYQVLLMASIRPCLFKHVSSSIWKIITCITRVKMVSNLP